MKHRYLLPLLLLSAPVAVAQTDSSEFDRFRERSQQQFDAFRERQQREFDAYRKRVNDEYAQFMQRSFRSHNEPPTVEEKPHEREVPPRPVPDEVPAPQPRPVPVDTVIAPPAPRPQPVPIAPIEERPAPAPERTCRFRFLGTECSVRFPAAGSFALGEVSDRALADAWTALGDDRYRNFLADCLAARQQMRLCDWAYVQLAAAAAAACVQGRNAQTFLQFYLLCQSGYRCRVGYTADGTVVLLMATDYHLFDVYHYTLDDGEVYYLIGAQADRLRVCELAYPQEQRLSLHIGQTMRLGGTHSAERRLEARQLPNTRVPLVASTVAVDRSLIDFYDGYPVSCLRSDRYSKWVAYAESPLGPEAQATLYPSLRRALEGRSKVEAVGMLLHFVQTAFVYEYDDTVWGHDRVFFPDETLFYPYADCEDRAILFSRLVRDLLDLPVVLLYYPGHLAAAVGFGGEQPAGDYLTVGGRRYVVCDPTYIGAPVGLTMPGMDNGKAVVIGPLKK